MRTPYVAAVTALFWIIIGSIGCNEGDQVIGIDVVESDIPEVADAWSDIWSEDVHFGPETVREDTISAEDALDLVSEDTPADVGGSKPCVDNADCPSGFCVAGPEGDVCAETCIEDCPEGWFCKGVTGFGSDLVFLCIWPHADLCRPCLEDEDCDVPAVGGENYCLSSGPGGSFCGSQCDTDDACPEGYSCAETTTSSQAQVMQCVPLDGECTCSPKAAAEGANTTCWFENELGTCPGVRQCTEDGLSDCDAAAAAEEVCDGTDDDCDGETDEEGAEGCETYYHDEDKDGFGAQEAGCYCEAQTELTKIPGDCDDGSPNVFPGASEVCNGLDTDCDGEIDEVGAFGCIPLYPDEDGDGWGAAQTECVCAGAEGYVGVGQDCDDDDPEQYPNAVEVCNDEDDDCDGEIDDDAVGCETWYADADGDGSGLTGDSACLCAPTAPYTAEEPGDCNDDDPEVGVGILESCDDKDNNCDGLIDEVDADGCLPYFLDLDDDGYGGAEAGCFCAVAEGITLIAGDCDDEKNGVHPDAAEQCGNGLDDDCDGELDEAEAVDCVSLLQDLDGDGYGSTVSLCVCAGTPGWTALSGDCDDGDQEQHPDAAEQCGNGEDDDCDQAVDEEDAEGCEVYYLDEDQDGFGNGAFSKCLCAAQDLYTAAEAGDCDDQDELSGVGSVEVCDGEDNDCDGLVDEEDAEGCLPFFVDGDLDGWGGEDIACLCQLGEGYSEQTGDCEDEKPGVHPDAVEVCNELDDNCDGETDPVNVEGCVPYYPDEDDDEYGDKDAPSLCQCGPAGDYVVTDDQDCDDQNESIHPDADEVCDGIDNDCDDLIDPAGTQGCQVRYMDGDGDGYGSGLTACVCPGTTGYVTQSGDCNDGNSSVKPGAVEVCNGVDDNCDGQIDPSGSQGCQVWYADGDGDGYGTSQTACVCAGTAGYAPQSGDCNDGNPSIKPGAAEVCNGVDDNCDFQTDPEDAPGCETKYYDWDGDTYGTSNSKCLCAESGKYTASQPGDCNDSDFAVKPGATETCDNQDNNCDGQTDPEGAPGCETKYYDGDGDGYGTSTNKCLCTDSGYYTASQAGDCNDSDGAIKPGHAELCDGKDNDCDGKMDDNSGCYHTVYRFYWSGAAGDTNHYYKTDSSTPAGYVAEGAKFKIFKSLVGGGIVDASLYRLYNHLVTNHLLTTSGVEVQIVQSQGYVYEAQIGYCAPSQLHGSMIPLYRLWSSVHTDHFYTTSAAERDYAVSNLGYVSEGMMCWVWPTNWP